MQAAVGDLVAMGLLECQENCRPTVSRRLDQELAFRPQKGVALWIRPSLEECGATAIFQGIRSQLCQAGYSLQVGCASNRSSELDSLTFRGFAHQAIGDPNIVGLVVWDSVERLPASVCQAISHLQKPVVFINQEPPESIIADEISTNHHRAAKKAVRHLYDLGHRSIGIVMNDKPSREDLERLLGFQDALAACDLIMLQHQVFRPDVNLWRRDAQARIDFVAQLIGAVQRPTALVVSGDQLALELRDALEAVRVSVPQDISIVGFDWMLRCLPDGGNLTTVAQPYEAIGRQAIERLLARSVGRFQGASSQIKLEGELIVRGSTTSPASERVQLNVPILH